MDIGQWKMSKDETELTIESLQQLLDHRGRSLAVRTLVVAILNESDHPVRRAAHVVSLRIDRIVQVDDGSRRSRLGAPNPVCRQPFQAAEQDRPQNSCDDGGSKDSELCHGE